MFGNDRFNRPFGLRPPYPAGQPVQRPAPRSLWDDVPQERAPQSDEFESEPAPTRPFSREIDPRAFRANAQYPQRADARAPQPRPASPDLRARPTEVPSQTPMPRPFPESVVSPDAQEPNADEAPVQLQRESADKQALQKALLDLEATEARVKRNAERVYEESRSKLVLDLLPVLDNMDRTLEAAESKSDPALIEGLRMVRGQLESVLIRYGVERIDALGKPFDPKEHEAVAMVAAPNSAQQNTVMRQVAPGYRFNGRILRAAQVLVGAYTEPVNEPIAGVDHGFFGGRPNRDS